MTDLEEIRQSVHWVEDQLRELLGILKESEMLQIKSASDKPCFICGGTEHVRMVRFDDKSFAGTLCMKCITTKTGKVEPKPEKRT